MNDEKRIRITFDPWLSVVVVLLLCISMLMVTSSSAYVARSYDVGIYHYSIRQGIYIGGGLLMAYLTFKVPLEAWYRATPILIMLTFVLLILVLIPGIGREINGAMRWIPMKFMNVQPAEMAKVFCIIYIASYLHRHHATLKTSTMALVAPLFVLGAFGFFLLLEPDFGSTTIILAVGLTMIFIAGVSLWRFGLMLAITLGLMVAALYSSPYRKARLAVFLDPWQDMYNQGYQLINSLIAIGRGKLGGVGIGESVQKLGYLPESHTDFIFSIYAEELGFFGVVVLIGLYLLFLNRAYHIGNRAERLELRFAAYLAYGIGTLVTLQAFTHMGVTLGLLPTKGLTLPLVSYGGSSMIMMIIAVSILFRIDIDTQSLQYQNYLKYREKEAQKAAKQAEKEAALAAKEAARLKEPLISQSPDEMELSSVELASADFKGAPHHG